MLHIDLTFNLSTNDPVTLTYFFSFTNIAYSINLISLTEEFEYSMKCSHKLSLDTIFQIFDNLVTCKCPKFYLLSKERVKKKGSYVS